MLENYNPFVPFIIEYYTQICHYGFGNQEPDVREKQYIYHLLTSNCDLRETRNDNVTDIIIKYSKIIMPDVRDLSAVKELYGYNYIDLFGSKLQYLSGPTSSGHITMGSLLEFDKVSDEDEETEEKVDTGMTFDPNEPNYVLFQSAFTTALTPSQHTALVEFVKKQGKTEAATGVPGGVSGSSKNGAHPPNYSAVLRGLGFVADKVEYSGD